MNVFLNLEREYQLAELDRDTAALERLFADDLFYTTFRGVVADKAAAVASAANPARNLERFELCDLTVLPMGEVTVVTGRAEMELHVGGTDLSGAYRFTHVFRWRNGRWQIAVAHGCRVIA